MPKQKHIEPLGQNTRFRVHFTEQREIFELLCDYGDKVLLYDDGLARQPVGESLVNFVYGNFDDVYNELKKTEKFFININENIETEKYWQDILTLVDKIYVRHPYFYITKQMILQKYSNENNRLKEKRDIDIYTLSNLVPVYKNMSKDLYTFISVCQNANADKNASSYVRYLRCEVKDEFMIKGPLEYSKTINEMDLAVDIYIVEEENAPIGYTSIPSVKKMSQTIKGNNAFVAFDMLYPNSLIDLHNYLLVRYLSSNVTFKLCKSCKRFFPVFGNSKAEYCNRIMAETDKTCRQIGAMRAYEGKKFENPIQKEYTKAYKTRNARIRYGSMTREEFEAWSVEARGLRDKCLAGFVSFEEFKEWLKK